MLYYLLLLAAGALQGVMVSLNAQLGKYYSLFAICFFVHGIALILLLAFLLAKRRTSGSGARRGTCIWSACSALQLSRRAAGVPYESARA